jgi:hypothetical protein
LLAALRKMPAFSLSPSSSGSDAVVSFVTRLLLFGTERDVDLFRGEFLLIPLLRKVLLVEAACKLGEPRENTNSCEKANDDEDRDRGCDNGVIIGVVDEKA